MLILGIGCSSAPRPPQVLLTKEVDPINFFKDAASSSDSVIVSKLPSKGWRQQFTYLIEDPNPSPAFFYAIAHADYIIAYIRPPSIKLAFNKVQLDLRRYGVITPIEFQVVFDRDQKSHIILECIKFADEEDV